MRQLKLPGKNPDKLKKSIIAIILGAVRAKRRTTDNARVHTLSEIVCPKTQGGLLAREKKNKEPLTGASPGVVLRIICTKMKCLPSRLIYNLLAWGTGASFPARTTRVTRVSTANSLQRESRSLPDPTGNITCEPEEVLRSNSHEHPLLFAVRFIFIGPYISDDYINLECCS